MHELTVGRYGTLRDGRLSTRSLTFRIRSVHGRQWHRDGGVVSAFVSGSVHCRTDLDPRADAPGRHSGPGQHRESAATAREHQIQRCQPQRRCALSPLLSPSPIRTRTSASCAPLHTQSLLRPIHFLCVLFGGGMQCGVSECLGAWVPWAGHPSRLDVPCPNRFLGGHMWI